MTRRRKRGWLELPASMLPPTLFVAMLMYTVWCYQFDVS